MNKYEANFIEDFWKQFNSCRSEEDYANLIAWVYFEVEKAFVTLPITETIAQIWLVCPTSVNKFVDYGGASLPAIMVSAVRSELKGMSAVDLDRMKDQLFISNNISVFN
jgi:hypothetical protein